MKDRAPNAYDQQQAAQRRASEIAMAQQQQAVMAQQTSPARVLGSRRGSTVPAQATDDDLHAAAAVPHAAGAGPAGRPRDAAGVRAARGGGAAARVSVDAARVPGFRAEASCSCRGLAPRLTIPFLPYPRNYGHNMCGFCGARKDLSESRARGLALMGPALREQIKRP